MLIDKHLSGRPARFVLRSPAPSDLTDFYTGLFRWRVDDRGVFTLDGRVVAQVADGDGGWLPYLATPDLTAAIDDAIAAGASFTEPPDGVADRHAVVIDPTGTPLGLVDPDEPPNIEVMAANGAVVWMEQKTHEQPAATEFLTKLFGYGFAGPVGPGSVRVILAEGAVLGGVMQFDHRWAPDEQPHWLLYFQVGDTAASVAQAVELGGSVWFPPFATPLGLMSYVRDPQGNPFALVTVSARGAAMIGGGR